VAVLNISFFSDLFHLATLRMGDILIIIAVDLVCLLWFEIWKLISQRSAHGAL
jgi:hypothetical protein